MHDKDPHGKPVEELVSDFRTHLERGLTQQEAEARLRRHGPNELHERPRPGFFALLLDQFNNYLVIILVIAALVSLALGEYVDSVAIMFIVALNAIVGVVQESKAEQALAALKKMSAPNAAVIRDGHQTVVASRDLVAGDIVLLEAGNFVPADLRLVLSDEPQGRGSVAHRRVGAGGKERRRRARQGDPAGRPHQLGLHGHAGDLRARTRPGHRHRHEHPDRDDRRDAPVVRGRANAAAAQARPTWARCSARACLAICAVVFVYGLFRDTHLADAFQNGFLAYLQDERKDDRQPFHDRREPGHRRGPGGTARHRHHLPRPGHATHDQAPRAHPQAPGRGDAGLRDGGVLGQDRDAHAEPDDGGPGLDRRQPVAHHRRGLCARRASSSPAPIRSMPVPIPTRRACWRARCCATTRGSRRVATPTARSRGASSATRPKRPWPWPRARPGISATTSRPPGRACRKSPSIPTASA